MKVKQMRVLLFGAHREKRKRMFLGRGGTERRRVWERVGAIRPTYSLPMRARKKKTAHFASSRGKGKVKVRLNRKKRSEIENETRKARQSGGKPKRPGRLAGRVDIILWSIASSGKKNETLNDLATSGEEGKL